MTTTSTERVGPAGPPEPPGAMATASIQIGSQAPVPRRSAAGEDVVGARTMIDLVVPVYNEQTDLGPSVRRLHAYLRSEFPFDTMITIADNASTDATWSIATGLVTELPGVRAVHLDAKGRGRALKAAWSSSEAEVVAYTDVDLSTDLRALLPLVAPLISGHSDVAIGTRLSGASRISRGPKREFVSRSYNLLLHGTLAASFSDAQCGFKAVRRSVAARLLPLIEDNNWFFDTELLILAQRAGLRIHEVPVDWVDDPDSRVDIVATAMEDLRGIARLGRGFFTGRIRLDRVRVELAPSQIAASPMALPSPLPGVPRGMMAQLIRFGIIGVLSTLAYFVIYLGLREFSGAQAANLTALLITAVANTAANRRMTFGVSGSRDVLKHHAGGLLAFGIGLGLTSGSLWLLDQVVSAPDRSLEIVVLVVANAVSTVIRFLALRQLMSR